jgi:hypothetical protein
MLKRLLIDVIGHASGLSELEHIEQSLPATKALIDLLKRAQPIIEQAQTLYDDAQPLLDQARKEWQTIGPAAQILIDVISHHLDKGSSPAEAAEAVRAALGGTIKNVAQDRGMDPGMNRVTVFGGTGFVGRRVVRHLRDSTATVRIASRHPARVESDNVEQMVADAHDDRSWRPSLRVPTASSTRSAYTSSTEATHFILCTSKRPPGSPERRGGPGSNGLCTYQE